MEKEKKILIIGLSGIGNTLLALPFLKMLREKFPQAVIDILSLHNGILQLLQVQNELSLNSSFIFSKKMLRNLAILFKLRRRRYHYSVTLFPSNKWQFNLLAFLIGARFRISHEYNWGRVKSLSFLQNVRIPAVEGRHDLEQNVNLFKVFSQTSEQVVPEFEISLLEEDSIWADTFLEGKKLKGRFLVGIHPGGGGSWNKSWQGLAKRWPAENFALLADRLIELKQAAILIFGGPQEKELQEKVRDLSLLKKEIFLIQGLSLRQVASLIQKCQLFISNDTGLMHLSAGLNVPTLGIFGPTNYLRTAPLGFRSYYIRSRADCSPCLKYPFHSSESRIFCKKGFSCLRDIAVEEVLQVLLRNGLI